MKNADATSALATELRAQRARKLQTQADVADLLGVNRITYRRWEKGESVPDEASWKVIAAFLDTEPDAIYKMVTA